MQLLTDLTHYICEIWKVEFVGDFVFFEFHFQFGGHKRFEEYLDWMSLD